MYKEALLIMALLSPMATWAGEKPDTLAILKDASFAYVNKIDNLSTGAVFYQIEFRSGKDCDRFEGAGDKLAMLSDYAYLFATYAGTYDTYPYPPWRSSVPKDAIAPNAPNPMVVDAKELGYAQAVLDSYRDQYHCPQGDGERTCVMHAVFKAAAIRRYRVVYDEGENYYPVDEDGKPLPPPPA